MLKAYKYCIKPTSAQQQLLQNNFAASRYVYNRSLALRSYAYKKFGINFDLKALKGRLPKLRQRHTWLKEASSQVLQQSVINLDIAFKKFFKQQAKYPHFKSKRSRQSIQMLRAAGHVVVRRGDTGRPQAIVAGANEASRSLTL